MFTLKYVSCLKGLLTKLQMKVIYFFSILLFLYLHVYYMYYIFPRSDSINKSQKKPRDITSCYAQGRQNIFEHGEDRFFQNVVGKNKVKNSLKWHCQHLA